MEPSKSRTLWYVLGGMIVLIAFVFGLNKLASKDNRYTPAPDESTIQDTKFEGPADAPVTLIEYSDFQCPACSSVAPFVKQLHEAFPDKLKIVYRYFPLTRIHPNAFVSARAAEAAHKQDKFWEMHDILFAKQKDWEGQNDPTETFRSYAQEIGLNMDQFNKDFEDGSTADAVKQDQALGTKANIPGTPTFFLNGERLSITSFDQFKQLIQDAIDKAPSKETSSANANTSENFHEHADFAVYINSKKIDFSQTKYQSVKDAQGKEQERDQFVHLHDGNGDVVHLHKAGITLGYFFKTLGMEFTKDCFKLDSGQSYCTDANRELQLFVNGQKNDQMDQYVPQDLDRILITYGYKTNKIDWQIKAVSDKACIYSEKCPERGPAPKEECVGGVGTTCENK